MRDDLPKRTEQEWAAVYREMHTVLHHEWDPIGVGDVPEAQDEYNSYLARVYGMIRNEHATQATIVNYLSQVTAENMGLPQAVDKHAYEAVADKLLSLAYAKPPNTPSNPSE